MLLSIVTPVRFEIWFAAMMIAAADVNPLIMGLDRKLTRNPALKRPRVNCIIPIIKASKIAMLM